MTRCSSAIRNDLHIGVYLKGVLDRLLGESTDCESLRTDIWATAQHKSDQRYWKATRLERAASRDRDRQRRRLVLAISWFFRLFVRSTAHSRVRQRGLVLLGADA